MLCTRYSFLKKSNHLIDLPSYVYIYIGNHNIEGGSKVKHFCCNLLSMVEKTFGSFKYDMYVTIEITLLKEKLHM